MAATTVRSKPLTAEQLSERLREAGHRVTSQRLDLYEALASSGEHLSPEQMLERVRQKHPSLSGNTVYQVLETLAALGVVQRADTSAGSRLYEANMEPHHHLVCNSCGRQIDVPAPGNGRSTVRPPDDDYGFEIDETQVTFRGLCPACRRQMPAEKDTGIAGTRVPRQSRAS